MAKLRRKVREKKYGRHSPAGFRYLQEEKRKTQPTYFKHIRRPTTESRLRRAGLSDANLKALGYKKRGR